MEYIQDWVSNEQTQQAKDNQSEAADVDETSTGKNVAVSGFTTGVWVVQIVVLLDIFWKQQ